MLIILVESFRLKIHLKDLRELRGVGTRVARQIDDDLAQLFQKSHDGRFAIQQPSEDDDHAVSITKRLEETVRVHAETPTEPEHIFKDGTEVVETPAHGPIADEFADRPDELNELTGTFGDTQSILNAELDELTERNDTDRGFD